MTRHDVVSVVPRALLYGLLSTWAGLTVARQAAISVPLLQRYEARLSVGVPVWRFFGPNPGTHDRDVLVRHRTADGSAGAWRRLHLARRRQSWHVVWAPHRRVEKAVADSVSGLTQACDLLGSIPDIKDLVSYRCLLNLAVHQVEHDLDAREVQFGVFETCRYDPTVAPRLVFMSSFHDLPPASSSLRTVA